MERQDVGPGRVVGLPRALVVRRLLERSRAGELTSEHVRVVAEVSGVSVRTVWRWLAVARETGQVEPGCRQGYAVSDAVWELLGEVGGNVTELRQPSCWAVRAGVVRCRRRRRCTGWCAGTAGPGECW